MRSRLWTLLAIPGLGWLLLFFLVGFYAIISVGLGNVNTLYEPLPHWNPLDWNVGYVWQAIQNVVPGGETWDDVVRTLVYVVVAVALSLAIGFPVAWYAARHVQRYKALLLVALVLPFWISYLMRMYAWTNLLDTNGFAARGLDALSIDSVLRSLGLMEPGGWLGGQHVTVIMALVYGYVPYLIIALYAALDRIDQSLIEAARDLGASPAGAFWRVVLPMSKTATIGGIVLISLPMFGDYYTPDLMSGSPRTAMLGNVINGAVQTGPNKPIGSAITLLLSLFLLALLLYYLRVLRADQKAAIGA